MDANQLGGFIRYLRRIAETDADQTSDGQLLERFARQGDEAAFTAILARHGPMVLGVCRRALGDPHDAEDAFQATFLVLAHKARSIGRPQALASWLYRIAHRTALRAKIVRSRRRARESVLDDVAATETIEDLAWHELRPLLDEEVNRLPGKYRDAIVHCYLQEQTYAEAAKSLGLAAGTVSSRLARARDVLRKRLLRRGQALSSSLLVGLLSQRALTAAVPGDLRDVTTRAALRLATGKATLATATTESVAALTAEVLHTMFVAKIRTLVLILMVLGAFSLGAGLYAYYGPNAKPNAAAPAPPGADKPGADKPKAGNEFENAFGYSWVIQPQDLSAAVEHFVKDDNGMVSTGRGAVVMRTSANRAGELVVTLATASVEGKPAPVEYRPVVFDSNRKRYLCFGPGGGHASDDTGAVAGLLEYRLSSRDLPLEKVHYVGVELLMKEGRRAIDARGLERAREAGVEVLPAPYEGEGYDFTLTTMDGKKIRGRDLKGKVVVIDCWGTLSMLGEVPKLKELYEKHHKDGLEIIGVCFGDDVEKVKKTCADEGMIWPQVFVPPDAKTRSLWHEAGGVDADPSGYPRIIYLDRKGAVYAVRRGAPYELAMIPEYVTKLLKEPGEKAGKPEK
jgi:RNA polymerase sigma factor (sigma-70 family)